MSDDAPAGAAGTQDPGDDAARAALERVRAKGKPARTRRAPMSSPRRASDDREPRPLGDLIGQLAEARAWTADLEVGAIVGRWRELTGPDIAEHCVPESFEDGTLRLRTDSTPWAHQLRLLLPQLHSRLEDAVGRGVISKIEILGPQAPSWKHGPRTVRGRGPRDTYG